MLWENSIWPLVFGGRGGLPLHKNLLSEAAYSVLKGGAPQQELRRG